MGIERTFCAILVLLFTIGCETKRATSEEVLGDIFAELVDSLGIRLSNFIPPPPPPILDKDSNIVGVDTLAAKEILGKRKNRIREID